MSLILNAFFVVALVAIFILSTPSAWGIYNGVRVPINHPISLVAILFELRDAANDELESTFSGTLIAPNIVLTASHPLTPLQKKPGKYKLLIKYLGLDGMFSTAAMKTFEVHPNPERAWEMNDLALVQLQTMIVDRKPAPLATDKSLEPSQPVVVAGYGIDSLLGDPPTLRMGIMSAKLTIYSIGSHIELSNSSLTIRRGDSGGPSFIEKNGEFKVIGVHSNGPALATSDLGRRDLDLTGQAAGDAFVPMNGEWIHKTISKLNKEGPCQALLAGRQ